MNDGIQPELCSLSYVSMEAILRAGRGACLAQVDIKQAHHIVPVHPEDCLHLGRE